MLAALGAAPAFGAADGPGGGVECDIYICQVDAEAPGHDDTNGDTGGSEPQGNWSTVRILAGRA
ncbi:hypothetical protein ACFVJ4_38190 [Streptomyces sp. NPDC127178]|uniref:hypothetical protein n=1 Tax=unclassified Streptomyces TaxID=2593676 RepID=UPI00362BAAA1